MDLETFKSHVYPVRNKLFRFALRIVKSEEEAKDIVQEALIKIWNNIEKLKEASNPEAWCMTVTKNLALDTVKSKKWNSTEPFDKQELILQTEDSESSNEIEIKSKIEEIISGLPEKQRDVIHLRDIEGYSYDEISDILGFKMSQVKVTLHRARKTVKEELLKLEEYGI